MPVLTPEQVKERILSDLRDLDDPLDAGCLDVVGKGSEWRPVYRPTTPRINEVQFAALFEAHRRLATELALA